jgi:hypothetical protein
MSQGKGKAADLPPLTNTLDKAKSPYLLQHKNNPVAVSICSNLIPLAHTRFLRHSGKNGNPKSSPVLKQRTR